MKTKLFESERLILFSADGWEYAERRKGKTAAAVIAITDANEIVLTEQYRPPVNARVIDLPAGLIGDEDESSDALATARKELEEETGFTCRDVELVAECATSPGITSERVTFVRARGLTRSGAGGGVGNEKITSHTVSMTNVVEWLREREKDGALIDGKVWSAMYFVNQST